MTLIDYSIVFACVALAVVLGLIHVGRAGKSMEEFFLAGRSLSGWQAGLSMAATQFAADTPLLVCGLIATGGLSSLWRIQVYGLSFLLIGYVFAPMWYRSGVRTDLEVLELRYSGRAAIFLRMLKAIFLGTLFNCTVLAMVLLAAGSLFQLFFPWYELLPESMFSYIQTCFSTFPDFIALQSIAEPAKQSASNYFSIALVMLFTWGYSMTGGLRSVVQTDLVQFILMIVGTVLFVVFLRGAIPDESIQEAMLRVHGQDVTRFTLSLMNEDLGGVLFCIIMVQWIAQANSDGSGYLAQRILACRSENEARFACLVFTWMQVVLRASLWVVLGLCLFILFPAVDISVQNAVKFHEGSYLLGIMEYMPAGCKGILVAAMLAALASTIDTHLNWGASYWTNDLYKRGLCELLLQRDPSPRELVLVARVSNALLLILAMCIAVNLDNIASAWKFSLALGAGFGTVSMLRWVWWRVSAAGECAAIIASGVLGLLIFTFDPDTVLLLIFLVSTGVVCIFAFLFPTRDMETLKQFYASVQPIGFWGPLDLERRSDGALYSALLQWFKMSLCVYASYVLIVFLVSRYM